MLFLLLFIGTFSWIGLVIRKSSVSIKICWVGRVLYFFFVTVNVETLPVG